MTREMSALLLRSVRARMVVLAIAFAAVPAVLAGQFVQADAGRRATLLRTVQAESQLIAEGLRLALERGGAPSVVETREMVERINAHGINMRLLLRPAVDPTALFLIAASPPLDARQLEQERKQLDQAGIAGHLPASCDGAAPLDVRYTSAAKGEEVLSSVTPFSSPVGCWAIITSHSTSDEVGSLLGRAYWRAPEVSLAAVIYGGLAVIAITLFAGLWRGLVHFAQQARTIGNGAAAPSFAAHNRIPELDGVAQEFDRMVAGLRASAEAVRRAAEDNAHAFKTPIATISQSLEPLRRRLPEDDQRAQRSLQLIEQSVTRLDALVTAARRMDEANASLVNPPHERIDLTRLTRTMLTTYKDIAAERGIVLQPQLSDGCHVWAGSELMETVIENIVENALSFSPRGGKLTVKVARERGTVILTVEDEGPGAPPDVLAKMFDRYVSYRPLKSDGAGGQHFGIGLWVVRRNVESIGGTVSAENRGAGGLRMMVRVPAAG
jgi:two-component system sensor histidine kinase ChvG